MPFFVVFAESEENLRAGKGQLVLQSTQAAAKLGVHERKIREFVNKGELTPCDEKFGCSPMYLERDIVELGERRKKAHF